MRSVPVAFVHETRDLMGVVHGDDFIFVGLDEDLDYAEKLLTDQYEVKNRGRLGTGPGDVREIDVLGRIIKMEDDGITWEGDPRHQVKLEEYFGMDKSSKGLTKNGYKDDQAQGGRQDSPEYLTNEEAKSYRMLAARLNYMGQDNVFIQFPAKEVCRSMANPEVNDFLKVKRVVRFLKGAGTIRTKFKWQSEEEATEIAVYVDSDWAGCVKTRRSTSGGVMKVGCHVIRTWSTTQPTVATSSGEAELIAMAGGASRGLGMRTTMVELGLVPDAVAVKVFTDSSAAKSFV